MTDAGFVIAAYVGILGSWVAYALWLSRRLAARHAPPPPTGAPRPDNTSAAEE